MTVSSSSRPVGTIQIAAALVFHLPGARLDVSTVQGIRCSVGPLTDPRCTLHPAEFREMIVTAGSGALLGSLLSLSITEEPSLSLEVPIDGVDHIGGGLYQVSGDASTSYAFATALTARRVDAVLSGLHDEFVSARPARPAASDSDETVVVNLVQDDGLGVTLVVMCAPSPASGGLGISLARAAVSACLVAEMEQLEPDMDGRRT